MDLNYNIRTWDISLRTRTITKITQIIVEAARMHPTATMEKEIIAQRATEKADKLDLLPDMITEIKIMIKPFMKGWLGWYERYGTKIVPILAPAGTVDQKKSARALLGCKNQTFYDLFTVACDHCLVDQIYRIGNKICSMEYATKATYEALFDDDRVKFDNNFGRNLGLSLVLTHNRNYCLGFKEAMNLRNSLALKYFLKKVSMDDVHSVLGDWEEFHHSERWIPPALYVKLFKIDQRPALNSKYYSLLLKSLLHWPYQHLFQKAAQRLVSSLGLLEYLEVLVAIFKMRTCFYEGYKCKELFIAFWRLGKDYRGELNSDTTSKDIFMVMSENLLIWDKDVAFMVLDDILESHREEIFHHFARNYCFELIKSGQYKVLHNLMYMCKVRDEQLYFQFKNIFLENCVNGIGNLHLLTEVLRMMSEWENCGFLNYQ